MGDDASLDEGMVGMNLVADLFAVALRLAMKVLIAVPVSQLRHVHHPEMVAE